MFQSRDSSPTPSLTVSDTDASVDSGLSYEISSANLTNQIEASLRSLVIRCHIVIFICYALMTVSTCSHSGHSCFENMIALHVIHFGVVAYVIFMYAKQSHINAYRILEKKLVGFEYFFLTPIIVAVHAYKISVFVLFTEDKEQRIAHMIEKHHYWSAMSLSPFDHDHNFLNLDAVLQVFISFSWPLMTSSLTHHTIFHSLNLSSTCVIIMCGGVYNKCMASPLAASIIAYCCGVLFKTQFIFPLFQNSLILDHKQRASEKYIRDRLEQMKAEQDFQVWEEATTRLKKIVHPWMMSLRSYSSSSNAPHPIS